MVEATPVKRRLVRFGLSGEETGGTRWATAVAIIAVATLNRILPPNVGRF